MTPLREEEPGLTRAQPTPPTRYGGMLRWLFERLFGPISYPPEAAEQVRSLSQQGTVVYVARSRSSLLALYFDHALACLGLPLARFVGGVNLMLWQPLRRLWRRGREAPQGAWRQHYHAPPTRYEAHLAELASRDQPALIFLRPPRDVGGDTRRERHDFVRALVAVQRAQERPIYLLPHALIDAVSSGTVHKTLTDRLFGDRRYPGRLRSLAMFLGSLRRATVRMGEPLNLKVFCESHGDAEDDLVARKVRHELNRRITEEERVVAGPKLPSPEVVERHVLRSPEVQQAIEQAGRSPEASARRAKQQLKRIAAKYNVAYVRGFDLLLRGVFNRIYDGVVVDEAGLRDVMEAARKGPVVYCPSHKSHIDYLVLSYVLWQYGIAPPHIAAGANLSFFPLGFVFRRAGAFFLRRSFKDDPLYAAVFKSYVKELVRAGIAVEFFLEGTRSRTGKVLMPRFGLLHMLVDAWRQGVRDDLILVPVSVDYERIIEAASYQKELGGEEKKAESIGALLKTTRVLRSRYGRVLVQFGEPISLAELARRQQLPQDLGHEHDDAWRRETGRLGFRILHGVASICSVTPTSVVCTALLSHRGRGLSESALLARGQAVLEYLDAAAARLSAALQLPQDRPPALQEAVRKLVDDGALSVDRAGRSDVEPIYRIPETNRVILDYHKNAVMNLFAPGAIVARVIGRMRQQGQPLQYEALQQDTRFLSRLFKREFLYPVEATFDSHFGDTLTTLAVRGIVDVHDDGQVTVNEPETLDLLASLLDNFVEGYLQVAITLRDLREFPLWEKELEERALDHCRRAFLEGQISRPEAANATLIKAALGWMKETGVLEVTGSGRRRDVALSRTYAGDGLEDLIREIASYGHHVTP